MEGQYVSEGMVTKMNKMEYLQGNLYQLIIEVTKEEPNLDELESIVSRDAALTYSLLKACQLRLFCNQAPDGLHSPGSGDGGTESAQAMGISVKL